MAMVISPDHHQKRAVVLVLVITPYLFSDHCQPVVLRRKTERPSVHFLLANFASHSAQFSPDPGEKRVQV